MKLTKRLVSLATAMALSCTFAASAATLGIDGDIAEVNGAYNVNLTADGVAETAQYTILVYKISDEGIADEIATATIPAPSNTNITYINQDAFSTIKLTDSEAYTIAFALGANVNGDGTYKVLVGGTDVATAAVGYFEIGEDAPTLKYGDVDGDGSITTEDAIIILKVAGGAAADYEPVSLGDVDDDGDTTTEDAILVLKVAGGDESIVLGPKN